MAQVITGYSAVMSSTDYIFDSPDANSDKTQYGYGTELMLPSDYISRMNGEFFPVTHPESGWIRYSVVGSITPIYQTVTDACTAPSIVTLSGKVLFIEGGAGGDQNTFLGYGISWRDAAECTFA